MSKGNKIPKAGKTPNTGKLPSTSAQINSGKQPKSRFSPSQIEGQPLCWRYSNADRNGPWSWSELVDPTEYKKVQEMLHNFEGLNWQQIIGTGSHPIQKNRLIKGAQDRLEELKLDDLEEIMSFRLEGDMRVFCIRDRNLMHVFWYDPKHEICPSPKRHT